MGAVEEGLIRFWRVIYLSTLLLFYFVLSACSSVEAANSTAPLDDGNILVSVVDEQNQTLLDGVIVRVMEPQPNFRTSEVDDDDQNKLGIQACPLSYFITVWASGFYISSQPCDPAKLRYDFMLFRINANNNLPYSWIPAAGNAPNCAGCHTQAPQYDEYTEWGKSGHAKVFDPYNRYFESMYLGKSLSRAETSPPARWDVIADDLVRQAPVLDPGYQGPGYKIDYPNTNGNCAFCHAPAAVTTEQLEVNPFAQPLSAVVQEGVTCDICHRVLSIQLNDEGYPYETRPGVLSFEFLRPPEFPQFYIGPLTGVNGDPSNVKTTCASIFSRSEFCAACHYGKFYDVLIYGSYREWRESAFADPNSTMYQTCQDCHMSQAHGVVTDSTSSQRQACSVQNVSAQNFDHNVMNFGRDERTQSDMPLMIKGAATIDAEFEYDLSNKNWFTVIAKVASKDVGHRFPTDSPLRHLILVIEAKDQRGTLLAQADGERIPNWAGAGDPVSEDPNMKFYAGLPGTIFANLLVERDTNISPTAAYWNPTKYAWVGARGQNMYDYSDTRLLPGVVDTSNYSFVAPDTGDIKVTIKLIYRFAFFSLMGQKGWKRPDVVVTSAVWECKKPTDPIDFQCKPTIE
jgi:nitrate/TMAO reductase-like tetraheme cytochrome c subunit